jgi:hypothetical protein
VWHNDENGVGHQDDWLMSPSVIIPAGSTNVQLSFWQRNCYVTPQYYEYHGLLFTTNNGQNWTEVAQFDQARSDWTEVDVDATALAGNTVRFAWRYQGTYATEWFLDDVRITTGGVSVDNPHIVLPKSFSLHEPYPNPFNNTAQIEFEISNPARIELSIYNLLGQKVTTLQSETQLSAGVYHYSWNADEASSGLYLVKLQSGNHSETKKLMLLK